jgi:predicted RNA-binding Zn-ribbon protein involved in translation (DUF1610 family)
VSKVMCTSCNEIIMSTHRHDFKYCGCGDTFIDGGDESFRTGWKTSQPLIVSVSDEGNES